LRDVVLHYHLFKNAGVSVDRILRRRLGAERWAGIEGEFAWSRVTQQEVARLIVERQDLRAVSSHQMRFPPPAIDGVRLHPLFMLREPIDRIGSVFAFERKQPANGNRGAELAHANDLAGYVAWGLEQDLLGGLCNFQTAFLGERGDKNRGTAALERAKAVVAETPCAGIVERYGESIARFAKVVPEAFHPADALVAPHNVTKDRLPSHEERVAAIREALGEPLYARLLDANSLDIELYAWALARFDAQPAVAPKWRAAAPST
jgi:hypothetical protein